MNDIIRAPWTSEQVQALNTAQKHGTRPPRICGAEVHASGRSPLLDATHTGWICPDPACAYTLDWEWRSTLDYADGLRAAARQTTGQTDTEPDPTTADDPTPLRWGLGDVLHGDDDTVIVCLSGPDREPYWLELDAERAAALRDDLAGTETTEPQDHPAAELYVLLRKAGEDRDTAQELIYAHARMAIRQHIALNNGAASAVGQPAEAQAADYDRDPAAIAWARRKIQDEIDRCRKFHTSATEAGKPEQAEMWKRLANRMQRTFMGGSGCVLAYFDERLPAHRRATDTVEDER